MLPCASTAQPVERARNAVSKADRGNPNRKPTPLAGPMRAAFSSLGRVRTCGLAETLSHLGGMAGVPQQDVAHGDQSPALLSLDYGQVTEAVLAHQKGAVLHAVFAIDHARILGHHCGKLGQTRAAALGD